MHCRLEEALETAAHTAQAAASSKELEAKQMIEDALLKKLQVLLLLSYCTATLTHRLKLCSAQQYSK
jgi:hypothetical protein